MFKTFNLVEVRVIDDEPAHRADLIELLVTELDDVVDSSTSHPADHDGLIARAIAHRGVS